MRWQACSLRARLIYQHYTKSRRSFHCSIDPVKPGTLVVNSPINVQISPIAFTSQQTSFKAEATIVSSSLEPAAIQSLESSLDVDYKEKETQNDLSVRVPSEFCQHPISLHVQIPYHYSVIVNGAGSSSLKLSNMECDYVTIILEDGDCELTNMKTLALDIQGKSGNLVFAKGFVGDVKAAIGNGNVVADKLQGQQLSIDVSKGNVNVSSLYSISCSLHCNRGDIKVSNCHGSTAMSTERGNIHINSVEGTLNAHAAHGNVDVHLTDCTDVKLVAPSGCVNVSVTESAAGSVHLQTDDLNVDDSLTLDVQAQEGESNSLTGTLGTTDSPLVNNCTLTVEALSTSFKMMDWITAQRFC